MTASEFTRGIRENRVQVAHHLIQVMLVGFAIGMTRTVVPALAESEFGLERGSFLLLASFVVAFGAVKAVMNFVAGRWSERIGRKRVLFWGWVVALPIPVMIWYAPDWNWIVAATVLLGVNQGLCWSMTQTAKLDITKAEERGLTMGLNEFSGYVGVAIAGILTAYAAEWLGARTGLLVFGMAVVLLALVLTVVWVKDTLPWAKAETAAHKAAPPKNPPRYPQGVSEHPTTGEVFALMSWRDRRLFAISQAGLVEKFVDALVWALFPVFLVGQGATLTEVGWIVGTYGFVWGGSQLFTGRLSDHVGRFWPNVLGMWICGAGVAMVVMGSGALWWSVSAGVAGFGMALLYPNLSAAVADITPPAWRGSAIGIYRFWRDLGYAIGALGLGLAASLTGAAEAAFWFVAISMFVSGGLLFWLGEETHPRLNPAPRKGPCMKHLILLNDPPYGTERSFNGLRMAHALAKNDPEAEITVFLMADAVLCAKAGQKTPDGYYNLERMLCRVLSAKGRVLMCGTCMDARGLAEGDMMEGACRSTMDELAQATPAVDRVLVF